MLRFVIEPLEGMAAPEVSNDESPGLLRAITEKDVNSLQRFIKTPGHASKFFTLDESLVRAYGDSSNPSCHLKLQRGWHSVVFHIIFCDIGSMLS